MAVGLFGPEKVDFASGGIARFVKVNVLMPGTSTPAVLFADARGLSTGPNPVWTDQYGELTFFAEQGSYDLSINGAIISVDVGAGQELSALHFTHTQSSASTVWLIVHNLGYNPAGIKVIEDDGSEVEWSDIVYLDSSKFQLTFSAAVGGLCYCS